MEADWAALNAQSEQEGDAVRRRAFEEHIVYLLRNLRPIGEKYHLKHYGEEENPKFLSAEIEGSYPDTQIVIRMYDRVRDVELTCEEAFWDDQYFRLPNGELRSPEWIAGEMSARARGW